ncbi:hypothetical protein DFR57_11855 [Saliterribacillus persicus]|uniref:Schlafen group 3-like DNA/RNA helicase domain-containing protein n=1 Tax=Saliterribacillus persicus TaxID=930114 RepID=A0A368X8S0_9BACI|nr:hypothetical protein DFR57_11855 [Saliterribacillus persicus]
MEKVEGKEAIVKTYLNKGNRETTHPSYQASSYASLIKDYNKNAQKEKMQLYPCAYLHNYITQKNDPLSDNIHSFYSEQAPIFVKRDSQKLRSFIKRHITIGDNKENLYKIEKGKIRPSKSLQDALNQMLKGNQEFTIIDDQKVVYEQAVYMAEKAVRTGAKQVLVVNEGPGTGKSVLAINLLVELTKRNMVSQYVTKNAAPRNVYATKLKQDFRKGNIDNLFKGSDNYVDSPENEFDALVVDEAHRLNKKSGMFRHLGENQTKEIIHASKFSIFFIDERQKVTINDSGSLDQIKHFADDTNASIETMNLESQFRCNGSDAYLAWIDDVLQIRETANSHYIGGEYDFRIFDDPHQLKAEITKLNEYNNKSRIVAGYCWNWDKKGKEKSEYDDIVFPEYDFRMSWNLGNTATWTIDKESINEAGCIHTCQGLEFDYVGVIVGGDLRSRDGEIITDHMQRANTDRELFGIKKMLKEKPEEAAEIADEVIRNTYRTLMTRGQKGCFIYCTDKALSDYFKDRLEQINRDYRENDFFDNWGEVAEGEHEYE